MSGVVTRERLCELLARAEPTALADLAERCLDPGDEPVVVAGPEVGMVMMQVREPVAQERFYLGEVLVTRAEVDLGGARGWAMVMGSDRVRSLAAAICDAEVQADRARAGDVLALCEATAHAAAEAAAAEWAELAPTEVSFEELD
ncbi:MAG: phosphonate C-P lyase system protein PhnG [Actinomycetota bacterium]|nr:phosphonate C-P lyase system protein PhnG [Actinomycetota bacterium]